VLKVSWVFLLGCLCARSKGLVVLVQLCIPSALLQSRTNVTFRFLLL
jgi:hypothetical protein